MKKYEILEHRADLKIRAFGKDKKELFLNMALAMTSALWAKVKRQPQPIFNGLGCPALKQGRWQKSKVKKIKIKSSDSEALLVDFLSEILYLIQINKEIYNNIKFKKFTETEIEAELIGQKVERFGEDIKAITYHSLALEQKKDKTWQATVLFDI